MTLSRTKFYVAITLISAILNKIELNTKWYYMLISTLEEFSELGDAVIPEIKESYQTGKPSTVEAGGARVREEMDGISLDWRLLEEKKELKWRKRSNILRHSVKKQEG